MDTKKRKLSKTVRLSVENLEKLAKFSINFQSPDEALSRLFEEFEELEDRICERNAERQMNWEERALPGSTKGREENES